MERVANNLFVNWNNKQEIFFGKRSINFDFSTLIKTFVILEGSGLNTIQLCFKSLEI